jgi:hypothetical protein
MSSDTTRGGKKKKLAAVKIVKDNPVLSSTITKLVADKKRGRNNNDKKKIEAYSRNKLEKISSAIKGRIGNIESILQLFPDIELAIQILVSSILSPKNMTANEMLYKVDTNAFPTDVLMNMLDAVKKHIEKEYKLESKLSTIVRQVLFDTGSYPIAIIPESSIDEIINKGITVSKEDLETLIDDSGSPVGLGFLGNPTKARQTNTVKEGLSMETFTNGSGSYSVYKATIKREPNSKKTTEINELNLSIEVYDNYELLKFPRIIEANKRKKARSFISNKALGLEDYDFRDLFLDDDIELREQVNINPKSKTLRKSVYKPLVLKLPSESVIPVHVPGDPQDHLGYFVLIDEHGNPITKNTKTGTESLGLQKLVEEGQNSVGSYLIEKARSNLAGNNKSKEIVLDDLTTVFGEIVENDLKDRLKNGIYGDNIEVTAADDIYRVMLYRSLSNHSTRLLYIPEELVTYFAYKYYPNGTGKSLMDDLLIISSLRAIMLFSKVMATVKNSIAVTTVDLKLDENDPDPMKTIETIMSEVLLTRQQYLPVGINNPNDLVDWIHRAGIEFTFSGHPGIPDVQLEFDTKKMNHEVPDEELDELLRKQTIMSLGLNPEIVDNSYSADFATTIVANNLLLSKRIMQFQEAFNPHLTDFVRKICINDPLIREQLKNLISSDRTKILEKFKNEEDLNVKTGTGTEDKADAWLIEYFINHIEIELPKPDIATIENMKESYASYKEALDEALDAWVNTEIVDMQVAGDISDYIDPIRSIVKAYFLRKWMADNNYMPELAAITSEDDGGKPAMNIYDLNADHLKALMESAMGFVKNSSKFKSKIDEKLEKLDEEDEEEDYNTDEETPPENDEVEEEPVDEDLETGEDENIAGTGKEEPGEETPPKEETGEEEPNIEVPEE